MSDATTDLATLSTAVADLAAATAPSVVEVSSHSLLASGFFWRENLIVTADETLADAGKIEIEQADGSVHPATLVGRDATTDIALLRVEAAPGVPVAFSAVPRPGSLALAIGAANSAQLVAFGAVAAVEGPWRSMRGGEIASRIELDLRLRGRGQGGLALSADGSVIGMAVQGPRRRALVIPGETVDRVAAILLENGRIPRGYLGLGLKEVVAPDGKTGGIVLAVEEGGPAHAAGLLQGDVIVSWNGSPVDSVGHLLRTLRFTAIGTSIQLGIRRGGEGVDVAITVGERPRA